MLNIIPQTTRHTCCTIAEHYSAIDDCDHTAAGDHSDHQLTPTPSPPIIDRTTISSSPPGAKINTFLKLHNALHLGVADRFWLFIFTLNQAKKWFNSIFNSKSHREYSFNKIIHSNWKTNNSLRKQRKQAKGARSVLNRHFLFIFPRQIELRAIFCGKLGPGKFVGGKLGLEFFLLANWAPQIYPL